MLIALVGVKNSGKDAIADIIQKHIKADKKAFANKIKESCSKHFKLDLSFFNDRILKESTLSVSDTLGYVRSLEILDDFNIDTSCMKVEQANHISQISYIELTTPRAIMQVVGTQLLRYFDEEVHCKTINVEKMSGVNIVTDVRMPNELVHLSKYKGEFIPLYVQRDSAEVLINKDSHESEKNVFLIKDKCIKVSNNGTLDDLEETIINLLKLKG